MEAAYLVDAVRTPIGRYGGALSPVRPDDLLAHVIRAIVQRNPSFDPTSLEEVISGAANQAGEDNRDVARMALLLANLPDTVGGVTVNRLCASGLNAVAQASRAIQVGDGDAYLAGGVESMSRAPFVLAKAEKAFDKQVEMYDTSLGWRFTNPVLAGMHYPYSMGETAENVADRFGVGREAQDLFAYESQQRAKAAWQAGRFADELVAVAVPRRKQDPLVVDTDEHPRPETTLEALAKLKPAFRKDGTVTAGNSSGINDGAAMTLVCNEATLKRFDLKPMARIVARAAAGVDPAVMGIGPIPATKKALKRAGLTSAAIGLVELNEAFASQSLVCRSELEFSPDIVNVNGGAIALGHPLGCSGARILTTLLHELKRRPSVKYGLATMCVGVGQGEALILENLTA